MTKLLNRLGVSLLIASGAGALMGMARDTMNGSPKWFLGGMFCLALAWVLKALGLRLKGGA